MRKCISKIAIIFMMAFVIGIGYGVSAKAADDGSVVGTHNLNNTAENSAKVGGQLKEPEKGWKRYDETNNNIAYENKKDFNIGAKDSNSKEYYNSTLTYNLNRGNVVCKFNFTGDSLRLISATTTDSGKNHTIKIDGKSYIFSNNGITIFGKLVFDVKLPTKKEHSVEISNEPNTYIYFDAVDISENGELKPYEKTNDNPQNENGVLTITMINGNIKSYNVSMEKVNDFIKWYEGRANGSNGYPFYKFDKTDGQDFKSKTEYIIFDKISSFEVDER